MSQIIIPCANWTTELVAAIRNADDKTIIVVNTEAKKELAIRAAQKMGKQVTVEISDQPPPENYTRS